MAQIIERIRAHYVVQEVEFGEVYRWSPECVVVECGCGERPALTVSMSTCAACGADHADAIREEMAAWRLEDEAAHPWRYSEERKDAGIPY